MRLWVINLKQIIIIIIINYNNDMLPDLYFKISRLKKKKGSYQVRNIWKTQLVKLLIISLNSLIPPERSQLNYCTGVMAEYGERYMYIYMYTHTYIYDIFWHSFLKVSLKKNNCAG